MSDIMMIEGLVGFGDLGQEIEDSVFPNYDEASPLWDEGMGPVAEDPFAYEGEDYSQDEYGVEPSEAKEKLQEILNGRREVVAQAVLERQEEQKKVVALDTVVEEKLPQAITQAASQGDLAQAQWLQYQQEVAKAQRLAAARRVVDLAKLQVVSGQMAKNARAQIALATLYEQAKANGDTQVAQELSQAYVDIGSMTEQYKQLRERQAQASKANNLKKELQRRTSAVARLRALMRKLSYGQPPERLTGKTAAQYRTAAASLEREEAALEAVRAQYLSAKSEAESTPEKLEGFSAGLGEMVPYCSVIERSSGGWFQCNEAKQVDLGDVAMGLAGLDGLDGFGSGLKSALNAVGDAAEYVGKKMMCPLSTSVSTTINKAAVSSDQKKDEGEEQKKRSTGAKAGDAAKTVALATGYGTAAVVAADAVAKMCDSKSSAGKTIVVEKKSKGLPWWVIPGGILVAGAGVAVVLMGRSPAPRQTQGLGRLGSGKRRRRHHKKSRKQLGCNCG